MTAFKQQEEDSEEVVKEKHESSFQSFERVISTPETVVKCLDDEDEQLLKLGIDVGAGTPTSEKEVIYLFKDQDEQIFSEPTPMYASSPSQRSVEEEQDAAEPTESHQNDSEKTSTYCGDQ